jgi:uncharacterized protein YraI
MKRSLCTALGFSVFAATSAFAGDGYVTGNANLRAGPDSSYPSVAMLASGTEVAIEGCVDGWSWCDVASGDERGWISGNFLQEEYQGQRVLVPSYGVQIGIPIVSFTFGSYWDDHYRNRSWYSSREHWSHFTPQYRAVDVHNNAHSNIHDSPRGNEGHPAHEAPVANLRATEAKPAPVAQQSVHERAVATEVRSPQTHSAPVKPVVSNQPVEVKRAPVVEHAAVPQKAVVAQQRPVTPKAPQKETPEKPAGEREGDKDKDKNQH